MKLVSFIDHQPFVHSFIQLVSELVILVLNIFHFVKLDYTTFLTYISKCNVHRDGVA
jgi:hypothetical protein